MKKNTKDIKNSLLSVRTKQASKRAKEVEAFQGKSDDIVNDNYAALYSKGLEHDAITLLAKEEDIKEIQLAVETGEQSDFDDIKLSGPGVRKQASPQGSLSSELSGADPEGVSMKKAPALDSREAAAEMAEVYLKNIMRDIPFSQYEEDVDPMIKDQVDAAIAILNAFGDDFKGPKENGVVTAKSLFRGSSATCLVGEYVSQLFLHPIGVGNFLYEPKGPTKAGVYGITEDNYLKIQNGVKPGEQGLPSQIIENNTEMTRKFMFNGRQLGSTVHIDLVFQHFYEAAAVLLNTGNVSVGSQIKVGSKEGNFLGGPVLTTTAIAEVSRHALRAAWVQKWRKNQRLRPEAMAARVVKQPDLVHQDLINVADGNGETLVQKVANFNMSNGGASLAFLPLQYAEGSPTHPAYPAGHATIAGACSTILKIMFADADWSTTGLAELRASVDGNAVETLAEASGTTIHGEIDKLAHNVALGRDYAGVHYRSDSELALGEKIAIQYYKDQKALFNEEVEEVTFIGFDGSSITV